jgi:hypothetical protein
MTIFYLTRLSHFPLSPAFDTYLEENSGEKRVLSYGITTHIIVIIHYAILWGGGG